MAEEQVPHTWQSLLALLEDRSIEIKLLSDTHEEASIRDDIITETLALLEVFDAPSSVDQFHARCEAVATPRLVLKRTFKGTPDLHARIVLTAVLRFACTKTLKTCKRNDRR